VAIGFRSLPQPTANPADANAGLSLLKCFYDEALFARVVREVIQNAVSVLREHVSQARGDEALMMRIFKKVVIATGRRLVTESLQLKHRAFVEEREWRLVLIVPRDAKPDFVRFRQTTLGYTPYVPMSLGQLPENRTCDIGRLFVGPGRDAIQAATAARLFLNSLGYSGDELVVRSDIPYRGAK